MASTAARVLSRACLSPLIARRPLLARSSAPALLVRTYKFSKSFLSDEEGEAPDARPDLATQAESFPPKELSTLLPYWVRVSGCSCTKD